MLTGCYQNSLQLTVDHGISTIAFPAISCGVYGYPIREACRIAISTSLYFLDNHPHFKRIFFVLFSDSDREVYEEYIEEIKGA